MEPLWDSFLHFCTSWTSVTTKMLSQRGKKIVPWPQTAWQKDTTLQQFGWECLECLLYSPDLAPSDFHLFGPPKKHLRIEWNTEWWAPQWSVHFDCYQSFPYLSKCCLLYTTFDSPSELSICIILKMSSNNWCADCFTCINYFLNPEIKY
jgi:hypothetical protein